MKGQEATGTATMEDAVEDAAPGASRPMRTDARRNYDRLVAAAKEVFATHGGDASMEAIAKTAGVGVGTLYRHFPKRIDVVEAVYRTDVDELVEAAQRAVQEADPLQALISWLDAFVRYAKSKRTLLTELHEAFEKNPSLKLASRERINQAIDVVLVPAQKAGVIRPDVDGSDLMQLLGPMCTSPTLSENQSERLLAVIVDGLRQPE